MVYPLSCSMHWPVKRLLHCKRAILCLSLSIFWKTPDIGLPSYSNNLSTHWPNDFVLAERSQPAVTSKQTGGWPVQNQQECVRGNSQSLCGKILQDVERLYCKRPIQCLASSKILTPHPPPPPPGECVPSRLWCGGRTHSLGGEGWGFNISEDARHSYVLYICKYLVLQSMIVSKYSSTTNWRMKTFLSSLWVPQI